MRPKTSISLILSRSFSIPELLRLTATCTNFHPDQSRIIDRSIPECTKKLRRTSCPSLHCNASLMTSSSKKLFISSEMDRHANQSADRATFSLMQRGFYNMYKHTSGLEQKIEKICWKRNLRHMQLLKSSEQL